MRVRACARVGVCVCDAIPSSQITLFVRFEMPPFLTDPDPLRWRHHTHTHTQKTRTEQTRTTTKRTTQEKPDSAVGRYGACVGVSVNRFSADSHNSNTTDRRLWKPLWGLSGWWLGLFFSFTRHSSFRLPSTLLYSNAIFEAVRLAEALKLEAVSDSWGPVAH